MLHRNHALNEILNGKASVTAKQEINLMYNMHYSCSS